MYKVSIIIPIYNREDYLYECLDSVVNQTMFKAIEIILINDGSTDNSEKICLEYVNKYPNIKYFYQKNQGVSAARNNGMDNATSEYIYFMDSDDTINDIFIESAYKNAKENNSDIVVVAINNSTMLKIMQPTQITAIGAIFGFYKRQFLKDINAEFKVGMQNAEDILFSVSVFANTKKISKEKKSVYFYRNTNNSLSKVQENNIYYINIIQHLVSELENLYLKNENNKLFCQNILKTIVQSCFYPIFWNRNFNIQHRLQIINIIKHFLNTTKPTFLKFNPGKYHWRYVLLYSIFNILFFFNLKNELHTRK